MRILFLQKRILFPADTGWKIRSLNIVRYLARWHDVTYVCGSQEEDKRHVEAMQELGVRLITVPWTETSRQGMRFYGELACNLLSAYPYNVNKDYDPRLWLRAQQLLAAEEYDLVICDFVQMARNVIGLDLPASLLFQHNVEAEIFKRHAETDRGWLRRRYMRHQWKKMRRFEQLAGRSFDRVIAVSERDREIFEREYGWGHVKVIDTAVDIDYFRPSTRTPGHLQSQALVFVGSLDWLPNEDGVVNFVESIWPLIRRECPQATIQLVGRNPTSAVWRLSRVDGVEVVGTVPDVRPYLAGAAVVVVPLRIGGGTRLKIFEAMAMRKAVVSTPLGAEGLDVEHERHLLLADHAAAFVDAVVRLLRNVDAREAMAERARELVVKRYTAEAVARQFDAICRDVIESRSARPVASVS